MALKTYAASVPPVSESIDSDDNRTESVVLLLESVGGATRVRPILLDQEKTFLCVAGPETPQPGPIVVHRTGLGWNLRARGADCRLNDIPVEDVWLYEGDRVTLSNQEFRVRAATVEELLGHLPSSVADANPTTDAVTEPSIAVAARERDLAEWEECLSACEADMQMRSMRLALSDSSALKDTPEVIDRRFLDELQKLRTDPSAFEADRQRLQDWLETLQNERSILQEERTKLISERAQLAERTRQATKAVAESSLPEAIAAKIAVECPPAAAPFARMAPSYDADPADETGPIGMEWHRPRRNLEQSRMRMNAFRVVANQSAGKALSRHFWKQNRSTVVLKMALVAMSFSLAAVLYWHHGAMESSTSALIWGSAAIGLITLSGVVHTWSELNRLNARFRPATDADRKTAEGDSPALLSGT